MNENELKSILDEIIKEEEGKKPDKKVDEILEQMNI